MLADFGPSGSELEQVAPVVIREDVRVVLAGLRAAASDQGATAGPAGFTEAQARVLAYRQGSSTAPPGCPTGAGSGDQ